MRFPSLKNRRDPAEPPVAETNAMLDRTGETMLSPPETRSRR
jgi:hypothetical protein